TVEFKDKHYRALLNPGKDSNLKDLKVAVFDRSREEAPQFEGAKTFDWPGEYDVAGVSIRGIEVLQGKGGVVTYLFHFPEGRVAWMGEMSEYPDDKFIEALGEVHVLILPVGGKDVLSAKDAFRLVEALEPLVVIPICHGGKRDDLKPFLKEMEVQLPAPVDSYELKKALLGSENMELVILKER
ncbi:MAG: MBL fold metallo-hydrolase, partial [bacterium]|nr:MBL fold metallo-hydrolase [bacterium]